MTPSTDGGLYCTVQTGDPKVLYRQDSARRVIGLNLKYDFCVVVTYCFSRKTKIRP